MPELPGQLPMFGMEPERPPKSPRVLPRGKPRWSTYKALLPFRCDDCVAVLATGKRTTARYARWRRRTIDGDLLLCSAHAQDRRVEDALPPLEERDR